MTKTIAGRLKTLPAGQPLNTHRVWCVSHHDENMGTCLDWFISEKDADQHIRIMLDQDPDMHPPVKRARDLPMSRKGLVRWLNGNFSTDNG